MAARAIHTVLDHLRRLHGVAQAAQSSDRELLQAFVNHNDQNAFAAVVARHAPLVWGVCRRILAHHQDAEDAFQATFLILARRAGSVRWKPSVGGWLHTVAQRLALRARKQNEQRRIQECEASRSPSGDLSLRDLAVVLDEELRQLPTKYREPLLLHYLEGATVEVAALQLGLSRSAFYKRLTRGRELLRNRLSHQGLSLAAPLLAAALSAEAECACRTLIEATIRGVMGNVPDRVAVLVAEAVRATAMMKLKIGLALGLLLGMAAGSVAMLTPRAAMVPVSQAEHPSEPPKAEEKAVVRMDRHGDPLPRGAIARLGTLRYHYDSDSVSVSELVFAPDGKRIAVASHWGVWLFDAATGKLAKSFHPAGTWFHRVAFSGDGKRLIATHEVTSLGPQRAVLHIWDLTDGQKVSETRLEGVCWLGWSSVGHPLAACLLKGEIELQEITTGRKHRFAAKDLPDSFHYTGYLEGPCTNFHCVVGKSLLAAGDEKGVIHVWDRTKGAERWLLRTGGDLTGGVLINRLALSADEHWLASLSRDGANKFTAKLWDLTTGKAGRTVAADQTSLHSFAFTPDSKTLATVGGREVRFWDVASGRERGRTRGEDQTFAASVAFTPDSKTMATAEMLCGTVHLWDVATGERKPEAKGHSTNWPMTPAFSPDGNRLATFGGLDGTIYVWETATGRPLTRICRSPRNVISCAFSADGSNLLSCWDDKLLVFNALTGRELPAPKGNLPDPPNNHRNGDGLHVSDDRKTIIIGRGGAITGWDTTTWKQLFHRRGNFEVASPDATMLALPDTKRGASRFGMIRGEGPMYVEDLATGERLLTFPTFKGRTFPRLFSPDGRLLISITSDPGTGRTGRTLRLWEILTARELLALPSDGNNQAAISPDGRLLALTASNYHGEILLWDLRKSEERHRFKDFGARVTSLAFSPDGRRLVSGQSDSTLLVWDVRAASAMPIDKLGTVGAAKAWADLASTDAPRAFRARGALAAAPVEALELLSEHLHPAKAADPPGLRRLLADLESEQFTVREKAQEELQKLGDLAEPALRQTLANKPTLEMRRRVQAVLERLRGPVTRPDLLQALRAAAVLEDIGTSGARRLLEKLATGAPEARLTREAKESLRRLDARDSFGR